MHKSIKKYKAKKLFLYWSSLFDAIKASLGTSVVQTEGCHNLKFDGP